MESAQIDVREYSYFANNQWRKAADKKFFQVHEPHSGKLFASVAARSRTDARTGVDGTWGVDAPFGRDPGERISPRLAGRGLIEFGGQVAARIIALLIVGMLWAAVTPTPALAQVKLPTVNLGETNFEDGFALPGWFLQEFPESYVAGELRDGHGNVVPGTNRLTADSTTTHVVYISNMRFLGGWLSGEVLQPIVDLDVRQAANGISSRVRGFGDTVLGVGLQWAPKKIGEGVFVDRFIFDVSAPTGTYSDKRAVNIGNHFVYVDPYYSVTYERKKVEVSARLHYLWNSVNDDPFVGLGIRNLQPGQAFHINYAASYEVLKNVRLGFNGYWLEQLTDDRINGLAVPHSRERTVGLGPGLQLSGRNIWFHLNGYLETDVRNRPSGVKVILRVSKAIPSRRT